MTAIEAIRSIAAPDPLFASWSDYLARTTHSARMIKCHATAKRANRRFRHIAFLYRLRGADVWSIVEAAKGRCLYCGSIAVEPKPPSTWRRVGRRVGSLEHLEWCDNGLQNHPSNLAWACLWCNVWERDRISMATDHGGYYPAEG